MTRNTRTFSLGEARVSVINVGNFSWTLSEKLNVGENEWRPHYTDIFERPLLFPTQSIHISLPGVSLLIDACYHDPLTEPSVLPPEGQSPSHVKNHLLENGVKPEALTHVVITHIHLDHYAGVTQKIDGTVAPSFPSARYFLALADWESPDLQRELLDPTTPQSQTLGVLAREGLLEIVKGKQALSAGVEIVPAPGETSGHQVVRVHSKGQTLYCLGDLYHHPVEIEHSTWMVGWGDQQAKLRSREALMKDALAEQAILVAAHIPPGRIVQTASGVKWMALQ